MLKEKIEVCIKFGNRLRKLRQEKEFSQETFADHISVHRTYLGGLERGERNPTLTILVRIANGLGLSVSDLLNDI